MTDGTGTTTYTYDQLDRLTESENGHKEIVKYEYDLANEQTKITYPNTKAVTRAFDKDGRLEKVTDWSLEHHQIHVQPRLRADDDAVPQRNQRRRQLRLQRRGPDDRSQRWSKARKRSRRSSTPATTTDKSKRPPPKACPARKSRKTPTTKTTASRNQAANTNTTRLTTRPRSARARTHTTKATSSKQAPA